MFKINYALVIVLSWWVICPLCTMTDAKISRKDELRTEIAKFSVNMYRIVAAVDSSPNLVISPFSAHVILALLYLGSAGDTKKKLKSALKAPGKRDASISYKAILGDLTEFHNDSISLANLIFLKSGFHLRSNFTETAKNSYRANVQELNFADPDGAAKEVNSWVQNATHGKISNLSKGGDFNSDLLMILINAIYFKHTWDTPFNVVDTKKDAKFYLNDKDIKTCNMMSIRLEVPYYENKDLDAKIVILPYTGGLLSMMIILPNQRTGIKSLEGKLDGLNLLELYKTMEFTNSVVDIKIPRFKIDYHLDLKPVLETMELGVLFERGANFGEMCEGTASPYLGKAIQKSFIEVNENGTEAGSVSAFTIFDRIGPAIIKEPFLADHPFMFILSSVATDVKLHTDILFIGRVSSP